MNSTDIKHALKGLSLLPQWWLQRFCKRDNHLWVFGAWDGFRYSDNSRALYEYVLENHPEIRCFWLTQSKEIYDKLSAEGKPVTMFYSEEGINIQKRAGFFFATKGFFDGAGCYMNGIQYINLWHGVPIKKIGEDAMEKIREKTWFKHVKTKIRRQIVPWEFIKGIVISGSPFFTPFLKSAFAIDDSAIWETPEARLDMIWQSKKESLVEKLDQKFNHPTKVIYMPTFRDAEFGVFNPFVDAKFNPDVFLKVLEEKNIVFIYKGHFFDANVTGFAGNERIITVNDSDYDNLYSFVKDMDILVTDYSSVYFDFLYLRKPMILFPFDFDIYIERSREFYFDYHLMAAHRVYTWDEMAVCLRDESYYCPSEDEIKLFRPLPAKECCRQIFDRVISLT